MESFRRFGNRRCRAHAESRRTNGVSRLAARACVSRARTRSGIRRVCVMDAERWRIVGSIFDRAVDAAPTDRAALLDELCAGDASLRRDVEQLLAADVSAQSFDGVVDSARGVAAAEWASGVDGKTWQ